MKYVYGALISLAVAVVVGMTLIALDNRNSLGFLVPKKEEGTS